jgi:hypothetical protein
MSSKIGEPDQWKRYDSEFHQELISNCGSRTLMEAHAAVFDKYFRYQMIALNYRGDEPARQHQACSNARWRAMPRGRSRCWWRMSADAWSTALAKRDDFSRSLCFADNETGSISGYALGRSTAARARRHRGINRNRLLRLARRRVRVCGACCRVAISCARNGAAGWREWVNERSVGAGASIAISARLSVMSGAAMSAATRRVTRPTVRTRNTADAHRPVSKRDKHPRVRTESASGVPRALFRIASVFLRSDCRILRNFPTH